MIDRAEKSALLSLQTGRNGILWGTLWGLAGQGLPLFAAIFAVPLLMSRLGTEAFGMLTIFWAIIGYFSLFDLGLGRATTHEVSRRLALDDGKGAVKALHTALVMMLASGVVAGITLWLIAGILVLAILNVDQALSEDAIVAVKVLAIGIPLVTVSTGLRGALEARRRFDYVNLVRTGFGLFTFVGPLTATIWSRDLVVVAVVLMIGRLLVFLAYAVITANLYAGALNRPGFAYENVRILLRFGSWVLVSNLLSPIMLYVDRLVVGSMSGIANVGIYSISVDVVSKTSVIPASVVSVLFPALSAVSIQPAKKQRYIYERSLIAIALAVLPISLGIILLGDVLLTKWLGEAVSKIAYPVAQIFAVSVLINGMAHVPFAAVQAAGRPDVTAKLHVFESIIFVPLLFVFVDHFGLVGAAYANLVRVSIDAALLSIYLDVRIRRESWTRALLGLAVYFMAGAVAASAAALDVNIVVRLFLVATAAIFMVPVAFKVLSGARVEGLATSV